MRNNLRTPRDRERSGLSFSYGAAFDSIRRGAFPSGSDGTSGRRAIHPKPRGLEKPAARPAGVNGVPTDRRAGISLCLFLVLLLCFRFGAAQAAPLAGKIRSIRFQSKSNLSEKEFRDLLFIKEGDSYDPEKVSESIKRLYETGLFADVLVEADTAPGGLALTFKLIPQVFVSSWRIRGNRELSRSQLNEGLPLSPPPVLTQTFLSRQVERVRDRCRNLGYEECRVSARVGKPDGYWATVTLNVTEGPPTRVQSLILEGNRSLSREQILKILRVKPGGILNRSFLQEGVGRLEKEYTRQGFLLVAVGQPRIEAVAPHSARVTLSIAEGTRVAVRFQGNRFFSAKELESKLTLREDGDLSSATLQKNAGQIQAAYQENGFPFAEVTPEVEKKAGEEDLIFTVKEGPRVRVEKVEIRGNRHISRADILAQMLTRPSGLFSRQWYMVKRFQDDLEAIRFLYRSRGYLQAEITPEYEYSRDSTRLTITVNIREGELSTIAGIDLQGNKTLDDATVKDLLGVHPGDPFNQVDLQNGINRLLSRYVDLGFGNASVSVQRSAPSPGKIEVHLDIQEGQRVYIGQIIVQGNLLTHSRVVTRELTLKEGDAYSRAAGARASRRLIQLGLFSRVDVHPAPALEEEKGGRRDLIVSVDEARPKVIDFGVGYGTEDRLRGFVEASDRNLWGSGRSASIRVQKSSIESNYSLNYREPWLFDYPVSGTARLEQGTLKKVSYTTRTRGVQLGLEKSWGETYRTALAYRYSGIRFLNVEPNAVLESEDQGRVTIASIAPTLIRDSRDDPINPTRGSFTSVTYELSSLSLASQVDFFKITGESRWYIPVSKRVVLALAGRAGMARSYGPTAVVPITERFFAGGATTVRGYRRDELGPKVGDTPTGGNYLLIGNAELRFPLLLGFSGVVFVDTGNVWTAAREVSVGHLRSTTGAGLRYSTPIGPLRLDYGRKLNRAPGESHGEFYFTIGYPF